MRSLPLLLLLVFAGCNSLQNSEAVQANIPRSVDSIYHLPNRFPLLRQHAGKKEGLTQHQLDSIQNATSLLKKF